MKKQPEIKKGTEFTGWAVFNWGICLNRAFRTRKDAKEWIIRDRLKTELKWDDVKDHFKVVRVKCIVE